MEAWLLEFIKGLGKVFLHPLLYWFLILGLLASLARIKRERHFFGTKIYSAFQEAKYTWPITIVSCLVLSCLAIGLGVMFSFPVMVLLSLVTIIFTLTKRFSWLSSAYTMGFTFLLLLILPDLLEGRLPSYWTDGLRNVDPVSFTIILGLLIIIEAILMIRINKKETFPELVKGNRGKWIGQHRLKKIAVVPFFALIPVGEIVPFSSWWPIFQIDGDRFGIILLPFLIGFEQVVKGAAPLKATRNLGQSLLILGLLTTGTAIAGYYLTILTLISVAIAIIGREFISFRFRSKDQQNKPFFSPSPTGMLVLGVIPVSPADKLSLSPGEIIIKVNGKSVSNEQQFYEALQVNSAYCKLDVRDERGELRFVQRAMYQGEHHELGIIFAEGSYRFKDHKMNMKQKKSG
ncbi:PDZ domain-containing protein [Aquibacillus albus]|uniref:PDZ domain-containing protein n=1 Tax=Aquibacillus albus TaxID=1168171 RepID=A0ABS2N5W8_9BACI|nr:PDZ domain-containing protein [Aquibacillus albus]MBM7573524.1 hypothetical protein [Aquibacillus albus]